MILGGQERQINVHLDPIRLAATGVSALEVQRAIATRQRQRPRRPDRDAARSTSRCASKAARVEADEIGDIIVRQHRRAPGARPRRRRRRRLRGRRRDRGGAQRHPGDRASVRKQTGTNTVAVVDAVKAAVGELQKKLPPGYSVDIVRDNSIQIRTSASQVLEHLVIGALLAALVVLLFLGSLRSTIIAAISIPVSIISTFGLMMVAGFTLNMMTLLALALAVGIVIDDAIVVLENIYRFIDEKTHEAVPRRDPRDEGDRPRRARDHAVADGRVPPGRVHERHRRPLPLQLRHHDGVRDRRSR